MWRRLVTARVMGASQPTRLCTSSSTPFCRTTRPPSVVLVVAQTQRSLAHNNHHDDPYPMATTAPRQQRSFSATHRSFGSSSNSSISGDDDNSTALLFPFFRNRPHRHRNPLPDQWMLLEKQESLSPAERSLLQALRHHHRDGDAAAAAAATATTTSPKNNNNTSNKNADEASYIRLRDCYVQLDYWDYALQTEQEREDLFCSDHDQRAASWHRQGVYWRRLGNLSVATKMWRAAREYYEQKLVVDKPSSLTREPMLGQVLISLAGVDFARGQYPAAAQQLAQAEPHCVANVNMWVECLQYQGLVYQSMTNEDPQEQDAIITMALEKFQQAIQLVEQMKKTIDGNDISPNDVDAEDIENRLLALRQSVADLLGSMEDRPQKLKEAQDIYESLLETYCTNDTRHNNNTGGDSAVDSLEASLRYKLGRLLAHQPEHHTTALEQFQRAVMLERRLAHSSAAGGGVSLTLAHGLNALGAAHAVLGQHAAARQCFREALLMAQVLAGHKQANNDPSVILILRNLDALQQEHREQQQEQQSDNRTDSVQSHTRRSD